jgi:transcriptional regulator of heat shock response
LEGLGYIKQLHTSGGRIPTDKAFRWYISRLSISSLNFRIEHFIYKRIHSIDINALDLEQRILVEVISILSLICRNLSFCYFKNNLNYDGFKYLFSQPEFAASEMAPQTGKFLDSLRDWLNAYNEVDNIKTFVGHERQQDNITAISIIVAQHRFKNGTAIFGVIGPNRQHYDRVIAIIEYIIKVIKEVSYGNKRQFRLEATNKG